VTATTTPAKNPLTQKNIRISSILVMVFPCDGARDGGAKAALFQPFVGHGVRPALRRKIKSNRLICCASIASRSTPQRPNCVTVGMSQMTASTGHPGPHFICRGRFVSSADERGRWNGSLTNAARVLPGGVPRRALSRPWASFSTSIMSSTLKLDGFCRGGKSLKVSMNWLTTAEPRHQRVLKGCGDGERRQWSVAS
jgi:hypothetical protein